MHVRIWIVGSLNWLLQLVWVIWWLNFFEQMVVELNQSSGSPTSGRPLNSSLDSIPRVSPKANFRVSLSFP